MLYVGQYLNFVKNKKFKSKQEAIEKFLLEKVEKKQSLEKINDWAKKIDEYSFEQKDVWVVADSTTSFINFNQN